ncbi:MAG: F0F1 ATP synthase subunit gamma [Rhodospirillales bacterium]|nr:F0F1 ATP synthase subunit gamma [Rhodospirillales bacterium]
MPSLKTLRLRIRSVKSTQKITSAMKMVAAAKLRRAQEAAEAARPYTERMDRMVGSLAKSFADAAGAPPMLRGTGSDQTHLIVAYTTDRGLCGAFNSSIVRQVRTMAHALRRDGKTVKILCVGRKGNELLRRDFGNAIVGAITGLGRKVMVYSEAQAVAAKISEMFAAEEFDVCTVVYNRFKSAMTQIVTAQQLIPLPVPKADEAAAAKGPQAVPIFEPDEDDILAELLPRNLAVQLFRALLEHAASEHGARMSAMDSATRNAGDMIDRLTLILNRSRQASITKELIEIISGAEAV